MRNLNLFNFHIFATACFVSCLSVFGADTAPQGLLLIGRFEQGGANIERAKYPLRKIEADSIWYVSPRSQGYASISEYFPCAIPAGKPQQFGFVMIEKGTLNEVVLSISSTAPREMATSTGENQHSCFSAEEGTFFSSLKAKRERYWQRWTDLGKQLGEMSRDIARVALSLNLLEESMEHGNLYYRIVGEDKKVTYSPSTVISFLIDKGVNVPRVDEYEKCEEALVAARRKMDTADKQLEPLHKRQDEHERQTSSQIGTVQAHDAVAPEFVFEHINTFIDAAWNLVLPGGALIVFAGDAAIEGTEFAEGISRSFLSSKFTDIEEYFYQAQEFEGQHYFANPVLPALWDIYSWTGDRASGLYFVIQKR